MSDTETNEIESRVNEIMAETETNVEPIDQEEVKPTEEPTAEVVEEEKQEETKEEVLETSETNQETKEEVTKEEINENINQDYDNDVNEDPADVPPLDFSKKNSEEDLAIETPLKFVQTTERLYNQNPIQISWEDLTYTVKVGPFWKKQPKQILQPLTGYVAPGQVLAVMGPSGSGKTSLLNILAQRVQKTSGSIKINNTEVTKSFKTVSAYVQQDDILNGNLTVFECLMFTALLRIPGYSFAEKARRVNDVIAELGLNHTKFTKIGIPGVSKGISGGERKRVSLAVEMLTSPSVLFLDEPTSGLDAKTALNIIETINKLAKRQNRTVICTIHQPRSDIYGLFDKLLLLAKGRVAFFGDAREAPGYFDKLGYKMPDQYNPADFLIDQITQEASDLPQKGSMKEKDSERIEHILGAYESVKVEIPPLENEMTMKKKFKFSSYSTNWFNELFVLFLRAMINNLRDKMLTVARLFQVVSMGLVVGLLYLQIDTNQKSIQDRVGAIYFMMLNQTMGSLFGAVSIFQKEKEVYLRERSSKTYRVTTYYLARTFAEIPLQTLWVTIFVCIAYWMVGLNPDPVRFLVFLLIINILSLTAQAFGTVIGTFVPSAQVGNVIAPVIITVFMIFGGFYINKESIGWWFIWLYYSSIFKYAFEALVINQFTGMTFTCLPSELVTAAPGVTICPVTDGQQVINSLSMVDGSMWLNVVLLIGMFFMFRIIGYLFIRFLQKPKIKR
eukprot:gene6471-10477_t